MATDREMIYMQEIVPCQSMIEQRALQQQHKQSYTAANFIQGPPPLIPDKPKVKDSSTTIQPGTSSKRSSNYSGPSSNMTGIPGVYFGYQIQAEEQQLQSPHSSTSESSLLITPQSSPASLTPTDSEEVVIVKKETVDLSIIPSPVRSPTVAEFQLLPPPPPALKPIPNSAVTSPKSESSYLTQQIMKSTSTLFNFIQLQVLSSISKKTNSSGLSESAIDSDGFKAVPTFVAEEMRDNQNTGLQPQSLTSYERNFLHDLHIQSPILHYSNSNSPLRTPTMDTSMDTTEHYSEIDFLSDSKRKRQKKTREEKLAYLRQYARDRRARETPEQREARLADLRARQRARKANETADQRKMRLEKDRLKTGRYRAKKRQDEDEEDLDIPSGILGGIASGPYILND